MTITTTRAICNESGDASSNSNNNNVIVIM